MHNAVLVVWQAVHGLISWALMMMLYLNSYDDNWYFEGHNISLRILDLIGTDSRNPLIFDGCILVLSAHGDGVLGITFLYLSYLAGDRGNFIPSRTSDNLYTYVVGRQV